MRLLKQVHNGTKEKKKRRQNKNNQKGKKQESRNLIPSNGKLHRDCALRWL